MAVEYNKRITAEYDEFGFSLTPEFKRIDVLVDEMKCESSSDCPPGAACVENQCANVSYLSCYRHDQCPNYEKCFKDVCMACNNKHYCPDGFQCNEYGVCVPENSNFLSCQSLMDCNNGEICHNGLCKPLTVPTSTNDRVRALWVELETPNKNPFSYYSENCPDGMKQLSYNCYQYQCKTNSDCYSGEICDNHQCRYWECNNDTDCPNGQTCDNWICNECTHDSDCPNGGVCTHRILYSSFSTGADQVIRPHDLVYEKKLSCQECTENTHCSGDTPYCSPLSLACVECLKNADCDNGQICFEYQCIDECQNDSDCNFACVENMCFECLTDSDCDETSSGPYCRSIKYAPSYHCNESSCTYDKSSKPRNLCSSCRTDEDCTDEDEPICNERGYCSECNGQRGCEEGEYCHFGLHMCLPIGTPLHDAFLK